MDGITNLMDISLSKLQELVMDKGVLACYSLWGCKEPDMTETELNLVPRWGALFLACRWPSLSLVLT